MKCDKHTMLLYAVTDRAWVGEHLIGIICHVDNRHICNFCSLCSISA